MFCTDKEQETCDVEKRGCKGCYYNGMSEEEIVAQMQEFVDWIKANKEKATKPDELITILQGMLDLYNQEKEERRKADHNFDEITIKMAKLDTELQQEKEKNKEALEYIFEILIEDRPNVGTDDLNNLYAILKE